MQIELEAAPKAPPLQFELEAAPKAPPLWGSCRLCYAICAFLAMVVQLCFRNALNFVILCMVSHNDTDSTSNSTASTYMISPPETSVLFSNADEAKKVTWSRTEEFNLQGAYYYGYLVTLPIAGRLADRLGGRCLFTHSITVQSVIFMTLPVCALKSYNLAFFIVVLQGLVAGLGVPSLYQLFSRWAHKTERTAFISFAFGGHPFGSLVIYPLAGWLCSYGWQYVFYILGAVALVFGLACSRFVYSTPEQHPRISPEELEYLQSSHVVRVPKSVPWKDILTSVNVYGFTITHIFHTYGTMVFAIGIPRLFNEGMGVNIFRTAYYASSISLGALLSKSITLTSCNKIENWSKLSPTAFRRVNLGLCCAFDIIFILGIVVSPSTLPTSVFIFTIFLGASSDIGFSSAYWPSPLFLAPSFAGVIAGTANCLASATGFLAPYTMAYFVTSGTKDEWNKVMYTLTASYALAGITFGTMGSARRVSWDA